jgi:hypothetical protein
MASIAVVWLGKFGFFLQLLVALDAHIHIEIYFRPKWWSCPARHVTVAFRTVDLPKRDVATVGEINVSRNGVH